MIKPLLPQANSSLKPVVVSVTLSILLVVVIFLQANNSRPSSVPATPTTTPPPIVEHFACSDYCPGPPERYTVKIYQDVEDPKLCKKLGGTPYTYYGWGEFHICLAPGEEPPSEPH